MILSIDIETYSGLDIKKVGGYKYAENAEVLLFAYAWDDAPVQIVDFTAGETLPDDVLAALTDNMVTCSVIFFIAWIRPHPLSF